MGSPVGCGRALRLHMFAVLGILLANDASPQNATETPFGAMPDGRPVAEYTLRSKHGMEAKILSYGATLRVLRVPDRTGRAVDVVLGYDSLGEYLNGRAYFGATIGRYANRIAGAKFDVDGNSYRLTANSGENTLHGGTNGFNRALWARDGGKSNVNSVRLKYESADGEEGFPGRLTVWVTYSLSDRNELQITYDAETTKATVVNFTNHTYFNLGGAGDSEVLRERLVIHAPAYTPANDAGIPTGSIASVQDTDFDFRRPASLQDHLRSAQEPIKAAGGYDVSLVLGREEGLKQAARIEDPATGITLDVRTTEPGIQLFTPNFPAGKLIGKSNRDYGGHAAICLETEHFPDSPHHPNFPSTILRPEQRFHSETIYKFSAAPAT